MLCKLPSRCAAVWLLRPTAHRNVLQTRLQQAVDEGAHQRERIGDRPVDLGLIELASRCVAVDRVQLRERITELAGDLATIAGAIGKA